MFDPKTKFLVVDDMLTMRKIIKKQLKDMGYENVVEAENGKLALEQMETASREGNKFGCVISDWTMPEMAGIELLRAVKAHPELKETPFILVTAEAEKDSILMAIQAGVSNYVVKPFSPEVLKEKLEQVYKKHQK